MTFDAIDFSKTSQPRRIWIANANGVLSPITRARTVNLSSTLCGKTRIFFLDDQNLLYEVKDNMNI
jgi:hypothetical protein